MSRKRTTPRKFKQQTLLDFLNSSPPSSPPNLFPKSPSPGPSRPRKRTRKVSSSSSSPSDHAQDVDSDVAAIHFEPEAVEISDDDRSPHRPKKSKSLGGAHAIPIRPATSDESPEEAIRVPRYQKGRKKLVDSEEDHDSRPRKRKFVKGTRPSTPEEDDDILDTGNLLENRLRARGKMTPFQKGLERLKLRKGRKPGEKESESSSEEEHSETSASIPFKGARPHRSGDSDVSHDETDQSEGEDFIVDDDADGVPAAKLPLAFSLSTHQDLTHHFKVVCQLFVHVAVQPLADRRTFFERALKEEEYLSVPLQVIRRKLSGLRDSLVASSVWRPEFKKDLEAYPNFTLIRLDFAVPECDACHLGGRLSTLLGRLSGKRYDKYDFEDLSDDESDERSEEDGDSDEGEDDDDERDVAATFHLGRFCAARTQTYHQFSHWEYSLYKSLQREILEAQDETRRFVKVAYPGGIKPPRDRHDADKMMEWLDDRGIIDMEWQKVRQMMDSSRKLERGETDDISIGL